MQIKFTNYSFAFLTDLFLKILQSAFSNCKKEFFCTGVTMIRRSVLYLLFISTFFPVNVILQDYFWINRRFIFVFKINDISYKPLNDIYGINDINGINDISYLYTRKKTFWGRVQFWNARQEISSPRPECHQILIRSLSHKEKFNRGVTQWTQLSFIHPIFVINAYNSNFTYRATKHV